jgi:Secretion system C-terminal sorting domain
MSVLIVNPMNMPAKKIITVLLFVSIKLYVLTGQSIEYSYDNNGNRIRRLIVVEEIRRQSPIQNIKSLKSIENSIATNNEETETEEIKTEEGEIRTIIYPNPNKGLLRIKITNMPIESRKELRLYDLSGTELIIKRNFDSFSELDIDKLEDGIYILQITINDSLFVFKVMKN